MSGEVKTKKKLANGKVKKAEEAEDSGISVTAVKGKTAGAGASLCTKFLFFVLLASLALTFSLFVLDYQQGQLQEFRSQLPPEVRDVLDKAARVSGDLSAQVRQSYNRALVKVEELSSQVPLGDKTLADILFGDKKKVPSSPSLIKKAEAEAKLEAEEKANKADMAELEEKERVEKENKRQVEEAEKLAAEEEKMRLTAEAENMRLAAEEEKRKTEEEVARKAAELEAFKKAEADAARLEKEFSEKQAAERRKRVEAEAIRKAEEELAEKIRAEKLNAEIEEKHRLAQEEATKKFQEAKKKLEETGAEFVNQEEFSKIEAKKKSASADAA